MHFVCPFPPWSRFSPHLAPHSPHFLSLKIKNPQPPQFTPQPICTHQQASRLETLDLFLTAILLKDQRRPNRSHASYKPRIHEPNYQVVRVREVQESLCLSVAKCSPRRNTLIGLSMSGGSTSSQQVYVCPNVNIAHIYNEKALEVHNSCYVFLWDIALPARKRLMW